MSARLVAIIARAPLLWTAFYTVGLSPSIRNERRAEILSDTSEHLRDPEFAEKQLLLAVDIARSLFAGLLDDLRWRADNATSAWKLALPAAFAALPSLTFALMFFHILGPAPGIAAGLISEIALTGALLALAYSEDTMNTAPTGATESRLESISFALAALAFPLLMLGGLLVLPFASIQPLAEDHFKEELIAERAAETGRWIAGSLLYGAGLAIGVLAVWGLSTRLRRGGSALIGALTPILFVLGVAAIEAGEIGGVGIGLAGVVDSGGDGTQFLKEVGQVGLALGSFGWFACGGALLLCGVAVWRTHAIDGSTGRFVALVLMAQGVFAFLPIVHVHGGTSIVFVQPLLGLAAFGVLGLRNLSARRDRSGSQRSLSPAHA